VTNRSNDDKLGVSAVLFDIDGTMIDTVPLIIASHRHTFNEILGWVPSDDEILATPLLPATIKVTDCCKNILTGVCRVRLRIANFLTVSARRLKRFGRKGF